MHRGGKAKPTFVQPEALFKLHGPTDYAKTTPLIKSLLQIEWYFTNKPRWALPTHPGALLRTGLPLLSGLLGVLGEIAPVPAHSGDYKQPATSSFLSWIKPAEEMDIISLATGGTEDLERTLVGAYQCAILIGSRTAGRCLEELASDPSRIWNAKLFDYVKGQYPLPCRLFLGFGCGRLSAGQANEIPMIALIALIAPLRQRSASCIRRQIKCGGNLIPGQAGRILSRND